MRSINDLWGDIGELSEDETLHVLTKLFAAYETELQLAPENEDNLKFFQNLDNAITQIRECNSNRR